MADSRHTLPEQYWYDGMVLSERMFPKQHLDRIKHNFELRDDDVIVPSYPKSGTTWMTEIIWLLMNEGNVEEARKTLVMKRVPYLDLYVQSLKGVNGIDIAEKAASPRIMRTHLPFSFFSEQLTTKKIKVIVGVRNIKDTLVSFYHFYRMNNALGNFEGPFAEFFELFKEKELLYGDWFDFVLGYWNHHEEMNLFLLKYEDLHKNFSGTVRKLAEFLEKDLTGDQLEAIAEHVKFENMKDNVQVNHRSAPIFNHDISPFMRKGAVGDWENYFTEELNSYIDPLYQKKMMGSGLELESKL